MTTQIFTNPQETHFTAQAHRTCANGRLGSFTRFIFKVAIAIFGFVGLQSAFAQISPAIAKDLLVKSGAWEQLGEMGPQIKIGIRQALPAVSLPQAAVAQLEKAADTAFDAQVLRKYATQRLAAALKAEDSSSALAWYESPTGKLLTALEVNATQASSNQQQFLETGNAELNQSSQERRNLLTQLVRLSFAAESMASIQVNSAIGTFEGMIRALPPSANAGATEQITNMRQMLERQRPSMVAAASGIALSTYAATYQSASDEELKQYANFMQSPAGVSTYKGLLDTFDRTMTFAARNLGQTIFRNLENAKAAKTTKSL